MGLRINLRHANWLAHILGPEGETPPVSILGEDASHSGEIFHQLLEQLRHGFHSGRGREREWQAVIDKMQHLSEVHGIEGVLEAAKIARQFLGERSWTALLLPSNSDSSADHALLNREFLQKIVDIRPEDDGLILQLESAPEEQQVLSDLFPAFRRALSAASEWPGILLWRPQFRFSLGRRALHGTEAEFLPLSEARGGVYVQARWLFETLAENPQAPLSSIASAYRRAFDLDPRRRDDETTFIHLSDVHIGSRQAALRLPRLPSLVRRIIREGGKFRKNVIIVSGDIMHTPNEENLSRVRSFLQELAEIVDEPLIICWGNHDARYGGLWLNRLHEATRLVHNGDPIRSFCGGRLTTVAFNSVIGGQLARGKIGTEQMIDIGTMLDRHGRHDDASLLAILHHHPVSVDLPDWFSPEFYQRVMPTWFGHQSDRLTDADDFTEFLAKRNFGCVLHGHKHIPHISQTPEGIPVFGCGSSVGKISTVDGSPYVSVNVVSFNAATRRLSARLLAERVDGGGLAEQDRAEILNLGTMRRGL